MSCLKKKELLFNKKHSLVHMKHMVTANQNYTRDIREIKESKYSNTVRQKHPREESQRIRKKQRRTTETENKNNKMAIHTYQ